MSRVSMLTYLTIALLLGWASWAECAEEGPGDGGDGPGGGRSGGGRARLFRGCAKPCQPVTWNPVETAKARAARVSAGVGAGQDAAGDRGFAGWAGLPYIVYVCSEEKAATAGLGSKALRARQESHKPTVFDSYAVVDAFREAGFSEFYKVIANKENAELMKKYNVKQENTLIFCAGTGEMVICLTGVHCSQTNVLKTLEAWPQLYRAWQARMDRAGQ